MLLQLYADKMVQRIASIISLFHQDSAKEDPLWSTFYIVITLISITK